MGNKLCPKIIPEGTSTTYTYGDSAHKHAVTALNTGEGYTHNANGNMVTRVEGERTPKHFDRLNATPSTLIAKHPRRGESINFCGGQRTHNAICV